MSESELELSPLLLSGFFSLRFTFLVCLGLLVPVSCFCMKELEGERERDWTAGGVGILGVISLEGERGGCRVLVLAGRFVPSA